MRCGGLGLGLVGGLVGVCRPRRSVRSRYQAPPPPANRPTHRCVEDAGAAEGHMAGSRAARCSIKGQQIGPLAHSALRQTPTALGYTLLTSMPAPPLARPVTGQLVKLPSLQRRSFRMLLLLRVSGTMRESCVADGAVKCPVGVLLDGWIDRSSEWPRIAASSVRSSHHTGVKSKHPAPAHDPI